MTDRDNFKIATPLSDVYFLYISDPLQLLQETKITCTSAECLHRLRACSHFRTSDSSSFTAARWIA